jgi:large subunit ribosomal protein L21
MYAIIQSGSKQYRVQADSEIDIEKLHLRAHAKTVTLDKVLMFSDGKDLQVGKPYLKNISVKAEVLSPVIKADKVIAFKYHRRKDWHWKKGHRQKFTRLKIKEISAS